MFKQKLLLASLATSLALPVMAEDNPHTVTGNIGFVSDYVFNGISQNFRTPALQGGFDYSHASGLYLGTWASNVSGNQYTNASMEWDVYGGYNGKAGNDVSYSIGLMQVVYPGGKTNPGGPTNKWDTSELIVAGNWLGFNLKYTLALTDWYGISSASRGGFEPALLSNGATTADAANVSSKGSAYVELNYSYELAEGMSALVHAGHQKVNNFSALSYTDYKLALNKAHAGFNFGLAYTTTNATDNTLYHVISNGDDKKLSGNILALSVGRSF